MKRLVINNLPELPWDVSEAINELCVNISFEGADAKTVMVTSSVPNEGKSFVSMGLWRALAESNKRTILIDCDMRSSEMRRVYDMKADDVFVGLESFLNGQSDSLDAIYKTNITNGYILPSIDPVDHPTMLLQSLKFKELIESCAQAFDFVIIDCPPLGSVSDALYVSKHCDGSVVVVRSGFTKKMFVKNTIRSLQRAGSHILGIVLNGVDISSRGSYYYKEYRQYNRYYKK